MVSWAARTVGGTLGSAREEGDSSSSEDGQSGRSSERREATGDDRPLRLCHQQPLQISLGLGTLVPSLVCEAGLARFAELDQH